MNQSRARAKELLGQCLGTLFVLAVLFGVSSSFQGPGMVHSHHDGDSFHAHSHLHAGAHRHDGESDAAGPSNVPVEDQDAAGGSYVPGADPACSHTLSLVEDVAPPQGVDEAPPVFATSIARRPLIASDAPRGPPA